MKSTDGGRTWTQLAGDPTGGEAWDLWADPHDAQRVALVDYNNLWFSTDGGQSFRNVFTDTSGTGAGCRIAGGTSDGAVVTIATNLGLLVSVNGGTSFALVPLPGIPADQAMTGFAAAKEGASTRFVAVTSDGADVYLGMTGADFGAYRSAWTIVSGQPAWTSANTGIAGGDYPFYAGMSDGEADVAWIAGGSDAGAPIVYRTTDGGRSWQSVLLTAGNANVATGWSGEGGDRQWSYGEYALGFSVSPSDPLRAAITDLGFVHLTTDGGASWHQAYVAPATENPAGAPTPRRRYYASVGIEDTTAWWVAWASATDLIGCYSDIQGTRSSDGGATWGFDYTGHSQNSMYHVVRHGGGRLFAATASVHDMYQSTRLQDATLDGGVGRVVHSDDLGRTWQLTHDFGDTVMWLALHPTQPDTLYASVVNSTTGGIYVTRNASAGGASTWTRLAVPPRTEGHPFNIHVLQDGTLVATYSGRRNAGGAFTASSGVFVSTDDGASWIDRSDAGMRYWTKDLVIDPHDPTRSTWYVGVFSGWGGAPNGLGGLYRSRNRGQSWTRILDLDRVTSIGISPASANEAYVTTEVEGLWHTGDLGAAAPAFAQVTEYPFRQPERVLWNPFDTTEIWVTSFGNGLRVGRDAAAPPLEVMRSSLTALSPPTPALGAVLPLQPVRDAWLTSPTGTFTDPDPLPGRPLVFYEVVGGRTLRVTKAPAGALDFDYR
jgi:photosystem II stability/assembly factor-like uncharacterized protein